MLLCKEVVYSFFKIRFFISAKTTKNKYKYITLLPIMWYTNHSKRDF